VSTDAPPVDVAPEPKGRRGRRLPRGPILLVVVVALVAAIVAQQSESSGSRASQPAIAARADLGVPAADVASSAWFCAAGTSTPDGAATETVVIDSLARTGIEATVTVMPGGDTTPATHTEHLAPGEQVRVPVADVLATAEPGVVVETVGGPAAVTHVLEHDGDLAVEACTRAAAEDWYFSSGTTVDGSQQDLSLFNPFGDDAIVDVTFATDTGEQEPSELQAMVVPRRSRITIPVQDSVLRQARVAAHVHARTGRVVAEQTETFDDVVVDGATRSGIALSAGATAPASTWRVAAGSTAAGGKGQLALANFTDTDARVDVQTVIAGGQELTAQTVRVPAQGVIVVGVTTRVPPDADYAVVATARPDHGRLVPVVAQLLATWAPESASSGLASTIGSTVTATRWVVPRLDVDAESTVTVFNPGPEPITAALLPAAQVDRTTGPTSEPELAVAPGAAKTIRATRVGTHAVPIVVTANHPVVVGLTVLGTAGAGVSTGIPDFTHGG
jgi:hypothetical protein